MNHNLIEPLPRNFTKQDYWDLWCLFCDGMAEQMASSPARDRVQSYALFKETLLPYKPFKEEPGSKPILGGHSSNICNYPNGKRPVTKYGTLIRGFFILYYWGFEIKCGEKNYRISIDFSKIADYFPAEVLAKRHKECPPEKDVLLHLYWEDNDCPYNHYLYEYSFCPKPSICKGALRPIAAKVLIWGFAVYGAATFIEQILI